MTPHTRYTPDAVLDSSSLRRIAWLTVLLLTASLLAAQFITHSRSRAQQLSLADRIAAQRAMEQVYWQHRIWPQENPQPKPTLDEVLPAAALQAKVEEYLRQSTALATYWQQPITPEQLQAEIERMARDTKQPDVLRELFAALGNDPFVIAECLARPALAERLSRAHYASDERLHGALQQRAEAELQQLGTGRQMQRTSGAYREVEWRADESSEVTRLHPGVELSGVLRLDAAHWQEAVQGLAEKFDTATTALPVGRWSSLQEDAEKFFAVAVLEKSAKRMQVAHVVWQKTPFDTWWKDAQQTLSLEVQATGFAFGLTANVAVPEACEGEAWTATNLSGAPSARNFYAAVWTGSEMIVWGGSGTLNTGGKYNPATDTWTATTTTGAPAPRSASTGVWSGVEMIVWGGIESIATGGRYNPTTNSWRSMTTTNAPGSRLWHTGVWSGSEMIVWGGTFNIITPFASGGRYNPVTDSWRATTNSQAPSARYLHAAVWTGNEMMIWGGFPSDTGTGSRYNPVSDSWLPITTTNAPTGRARPSVVWTGTNMIIWGNAVLNTGGQYNPATDSWTATSTTNAPSPRSDQSAVWTGSEMIIWGGIAGTSPNFTNFNSGGRYNPVANTWIATTTTNAPSARSTQTAIWTGNEMIIWGGFLGSGATNTPLNTGGRYTISEGLSIAPANQSFPANGGSGNITVTSASSCSWTAVSNANWITINSGSGSGNGAVAFTVAANTSTTPRTGTITVTGQAFTVTQAAPNPVASVNAASYAPDAPLAPDSIVSAFGQDLANSATGQGVSSLPLPTTLNGTTVRVKDSLGAERLAGLFYVGKMQVNYLLPAETALGTATVTITTGAGIVSTGMVQLAAVTPGLFTANQDGKDAPAGFAIHVKPNGDQTRESLSMPDSTTMKQVPRPIDLGPENEMVILELYGTGIRKRSSQSVVTATIGGIAAPVEYADQHPEYVGLDQVNIKVPRVLIGRGEVEVVLMVDGKVANVVKIHIR